MEKTLKQYYDSMEWDMFLLIFLEVLAGIIKQEEKIKGIEI